MGEMGKNSTFIVFMALFF